MKAEHRHELETNILADGVGKVISRVKKKPSRSSLWYFVFGIAAFLVLILVYRSYQLSRDDVTRNWMNLANGSKDLVDSLAANDSDTNPGKAALLERTWLIYWEEGFKMLGHQPTYALKNLDFAYESYVKAEKLCQGDPIFEPEAMFGKAMVEETRAVQDRKKLTVARELFHQLAEKYPASAYGKLAKEREDILKDGPKFTELVEFYTTLQERLIIPNRIEPRDLEKIAPKAKNNKPDEKKEDKQDSK